MAKSEHLLKGLEGISEPEYRKLQDFLVTHSARKLEVEGKVISYIVCGSGSSTLLTFAGGWGGPEMLYDTILGFEPDNRVVVIDISPYADPDEMAAGVNRVLEHENIGRVVVTGQSMSGIIAQSYFKRNHGRIDGLVLTNTLAPRAERNKKWALVLLRVIPLSLFKPLAKKKLSQLSTFDKEIPQETLQRMRFKMAFMANMVQSYFTRKTVLNILKLAFAFNLKDGYTADDFKGWKGKTLVITSEDDPYFPDSELLLKNLPNSERHMLPSGYKHVAPMILRDEFHAVIQGFIDRIGPPPV